MKIDKFNDEVISELKYYVYKLIDPRNGKVFYVGMGHGNRIFDHVKGVLKNTDLEDWQDEETEKIKIIKEILGEGLEVIAIIHRHHLDKDTALEVEAALIDAYSGLANRISGINSEYGVASILQIVNRYGLEKITEFKEEDKILIIKIKQDSININGSIYEAVRCWWKLSQNRLEKVKQVAAVVDGVVKKVYQVNKWNYNDKLERYGFEGIEIEDSPYLNKRIPDEYRTKGVANPVLYTFKD